MVIEISLAIAIMSTISAFVFGILNVRRASKGETQAGAERMAVVITKLDTIEAAVQEIKTDICGVKQESKEMRERLTRVEESSKDTRGRVDKIERTGA